MNEKNLHTYLVSIEAVCAWYGHVKVKAENEAEARREAWARRQEWEMDFSATEPIDPIIFDSDIEQLDEEEEEE